MLEEGKVAASGHPSPLIRNLIDRVDILCY